MPPINIVDNQYITVQYLPEKQMIYHTVHQPIYDIRLLKDALNAGTDALQKYGVYKWLSDDRKNGALPPEVVEWGLEDWNPRTIAAGWRYWANVVPKELAAAGALMPVMEALFGMGLRMMVFSDLDEAIAWLDSV
ncbi:MAG: hypothetical protein U0670_03685 [Anaerolineae bacterium]